MSQQYSSVIAVLLSGVLRAAARLILLNTILCVKPYVLIEPRRKNQVFVGSKNMGYISDTVRNRIHNLFRPKYEPIPLSHSDGQAPAVEKQCSRSDTHRTALARRSTKSNIHIVRARTSMPPWVCSALSCPLL